MSTMDWSKLKQQADDATKPAPIGEYIVEITKCEAAHASTSGNPMLKMTGRIVEGPCEGKTVFNNFNITPDSAFALSIFFRHMESLGLGTDYFATNPEVEQIAQDLVGRRAKFTLGIRTWQGVDRNQVDNIQPLPGFVNPTPASQGGVPVPGAVATAAPTAPPVPGNAPAPTPQMGATPPPVPAF